MPVTLRALPLDLPLARPFRTSRGQKTVAKNLLVGMNQTGSSEEERAPPSNATGRIRTPGCEP